MGDPAVRYVNAEEAQNAFLLETEGYPEDEASSLHTLLYRQKEAPHLFLGYFEEDDTLAGGIALKLLNEYTERVKKTEAGATSILLICKAGLIPLYTKAGYTLVGKSPVVHGKDTWYEMKHAI